MMLKLISCVLSFSLIVTSITPSLAQVPLRPGGLRRGISAVQVSPRVRTGQLPVNPVPVSQAVLLKNMRLSLSLPHAQSFTASSLPVARQILSHQDEAQRALWLRADFPVLVLNGKVSMQDMHSAAQFYRTQLQQTEKIFSQVPFGAGRISADVTKKLAGAVADVSSLGIFGNAEQDAPLILQVYKKSVGTEAEPLMTVTCARALLRLQAYDTLKKMSEISTQQPKLWQGIEQYVQAYNLPVTLAQRARSSGNVKILKEETLEWGPLNKLMLKPEVESTFLYMNAGKEPPTPRGQATARQTTAQWPGQTTVAEPAQPTFASQGAPFENIKPVQPIRIATTLQEVPPLEPSLSHVPERFHQVQTTNALGNQVLTWEPVTPVEQTDVPSTGPALSWLDKARLQWAMRFKPALEDMFNFGASRYGVAVLGTGGAPITSEGAVATALSMDIPAVVQTVRAQQGTFIAEDLLRSGSGASYRMGAVNPGGVAAQQFASQTLQSTTAKANLSGLGYLTPSMLYSMRLGVPGYGDRLYSSFLPIPSFLTKRFAKNKTVAVQEEALVPGQQMVEVARPLTRANRIWARFAKVPGLGFTARFAEPKVEQVRFTYQQVWFNVKTQSIEYAQPGKDIPSGFRAFTIAQTPLFIAPPEVNPKAVQAITNKLTEDAQKEASQTGKPVNQKELQARIEKAKNNLPEAIAVRKADLIAQYILNSTQAQREDLVWVLASDAQATYKVQASKKMEQLYMKPITLQELLAKRVSLQRQTHLKVNLKKDELTDIAERVSSRLQQENLGQLVPQEDPLLSQGLTWHELTNVDQARLTEALYPQENMEDLLRYSTRETLGGNTIYDKVLPVYVRDASGDTKGTPQLYLLLNKPFVMPRGFRVVIDESGHFKVAPQNLRAVESSRMPYNPVLKAIYKWQPNFLDNLPWVKNNPRRLRAWDSGARRRVFETPLKASELTALNYILSNRPGQVAVLPTAPNDTFEGLMNLVAIVAGADLGASLSSQLKKTFSSEAAVTGTSGGGYISPKVANWFAPLINKYGYYSILRGGFLTMLGISALGMFSGLWQPDGWASGMLGAFDPSASTANMVLSIAFMSVAMVTASVFSMLAGPILKSTYTDPTVFSSKNMEFTTNKGLSRLLVTAGTGTLFALVKNALDIDLNWSVLVPVMAGLSGFGLIKLKGSRLYKEHQSLKKEKSQLQPETELSPEQIKAKKAQEKRLKKEMKAKYKATFAKPLKGITNRLGLIYLTYGNVNSVILGILAGILYSPATAMYIGGAGLFISWLVRKAADKLIKSRVITEDQLTGMSLPLMLAGVATGLFAPFGSASMGIFFGLMYLSTPTFGVSENTRMMNYIASYYKAQREQVNTNEALSNAEKEAKLKAINKEQEAMKVAAASSYNSHNSWGVYPILATTALVALAKDGLLGTTIAQHLSQWFQDAASVFRMGTDAAAFDVTKTDAPLDFAIYRLTLLPALAFGMILNWKNGAMIKQGMKRLFSSIAVSKEDIADVEHNDIPADLQIDFKNINATIEEISKEVEELDAAIRAFKDSRTSEERLQGWANRMVWVNNRLKAIIDTKPILTGRLSTELYTMRSLAKSFMLLLNYNDVSDGLRQQGQVLYQSLGLAIELSGEENIATAQERFEGLLNQLPAGAFKNKEEQMDLVKRALQSNDSEQLTNMIESFPTDIVTRNMKNNLLKLSHEVLEENQLPVLDVANRGLKYIPELKLSAVDAMRRRLHIGKDPAKGIFAGSDVQDYEQAKLLVREMKTMLNEAQHGVITNGMFEQFKTFYAKAIKHLQKYVRKNVALGQNTMDSRVMVLKEEMDNLYREYLDQEPPEANFAVEPNFDGLQDAELVPSN